MGAGQGVPAAKDAERSDRGGEPPRGVAPSAAESSGVQLWERGWLAAERRRRQGFLMGGV